MPADNFSIFGQPTPPETPRTLRAGPLTLQFHEGDLRYVKWGEREVIRRIYGAVRDQFWNTIPSRLDLTSVASSDTGFRIAYRRRHQRDDIDFVWDAELIGEADGTLRFRFDGAAQTTFLKNRVGLCVLHPVEACAGNLAQVRYTDGTSSEVMFPKLIAVEQPVTGFENLAGLAHEVAPGIWLEFEFSGDVFETEDQRNWIDASFKTFCTRLRLPRPVRVEAGARIRQEIVVRLRGRPKVTLPITSSESNALTVRQRGELTPLPDLGLGAAFLRLPLAPEEAARIGALAVGHLRAEINLEDNDWQPRLSAATREAGELGLPLELAVQWSPAAPPDALTELRRELTRRRADVLRVTALSAGRHSTTAEALAAVRAALGDLETPIGVGTTGDLYQLNLERPAPGGDFVSWSMNPQVHAFDELSLIETPAAAADQIASASQYFAGMPLVISPITLRPRGDARSAHSDLTAPRRELPWSVDPRQMSLLGAAWTVAMLAALAPSGVTSLTFFETIGWRGVMEGLSGSPMLQEFPSAPGQVFPVWHVFAAMRDARKAAACAVGDSLSVAGLVLADRAGGVRWILANLRADPTRVTLPEVASGVGRVLDATNVATATRDPEAFWGRPAVPLAATLELSAHALAFIENRPPAA